MSDVPSSAAPSDVGGASCHSGEERLNSVMSHIHQQDDTSAPASPPSPSSFSQQSPGACGPAVASRPSVSSARHDQSDDNKDDTDSSDKDKEEDVMDMRVNEDWTAEEVRDFARRRWPQLKGFADQCYENFVNGASFEIRFTILHVVLSVFKNFELLLCFCVVMLNSSAIPRVCCRVKQSCFVYFGAVSICRAIPCSQFASRTTRTATTHQHAVCMMYNSAASLRIPSSGIVDNRLHVFVLWVRASCYLMAVETMP